VDLPRWAPESGKAALIVMPVVVNQTHETRQPTDLRPFRRCARTHPLSYTPGSSKLPCGSFRAWKPGGAGPRKMLIW
jgi:hypothetical protein